MIAKRVQMKSGRTSSFRRLVKYITNEFDKAERIASVHVAHCQNRDIAWATEEVVAIQGKNQRAENDKTYHLLISFAPGEVVPIDALEEIESRICDALGFGEHQRISAIHNDTDSLHIHVAINKIHPRRLTIHEPYRDFHTLGQICERLEIEHNLVRTNHVGKKSTSENHATDMERHAGVESLLGWIKRGCASQMQVAQTWGELHSVLAANGLDIRQQANGLVIQDQTGLTVKASSISRNLSKPKLEARLGAFVSASTHPDRRQNLQLSARDNRDDRSPVNTTAAPIEATRRPGSDRPRVARVGTRPPPFRQGRHHVITQLNQIQITNGRLPSVPIRVPPVSKAGANPPPERRRIQQYVQTIEQIRIESPRRYSPEPVRVRVDTTELYAQYKAFASGVHDARIKACERIRIDRNQRIEAAKQAGRLKRLATKLLGESGPQKRLLYSLTSKALTARIQTINADYMQQRQRIFDQYSRMTWVDWLQAEAKTGNADALAALRARESGGKGNRNGVRGHGPTVFKSAPQLTPDNVTKLGTVIYRVGSSAIRDDGAELKLSYGATIDALETALRMAMQRYGSRITVNGTADFKAQIVRVAAIRNLSLSFADPALEDRRHSFIRTIQQQKTNVSSDQRRDRRSASRGQSDLNTPGTRADVLPLVVARATTVSQKIISTVHASIEAAAQTATDGQSAASIRAKPGVAGVGRKPPAIRRNRLRSLSELGAIHIDSGREVLLARDVSRDVEHDDASRSGELPRKVDSTGARVTADAAARKYIAEREQKRALGFEIPRHSRYGDHEKGEARYAGQRMIDAQHLALLARGDEITVLPVDNSTASMLKRLKLGDVVRVSADGVITAAVSRKRGRTR